MSELLYTLWMLAPTLAVLAIITATVLLCASVETALAPWRARRAATKRAREGFPRAIARKEA